MSGSVGRAEVADYQSAASPDPTLLEPSGQQNRRGGKGRCFVDALCLTWRGLVSAVVASSAAGGSAPADPVRALQHTLYRAAKADPGRWFHALWDKVYRRDVLWRAWVSVFRNGGAPGIDKTTLVDVQEYGVTRLLDELAAELRNGSYRPMPARRVLIPKPGGKGVRVLGVPTRVAYRAPAQVC